MNLSQKRKVASSFDNKLEFYIKMSIKMPQPYQFEKIFSEAHFNKWKARSLDEKLEDMGHINNQLMKYDCGIAILVTAINYCDTLLSCASMVAAGGAVSMRLRLAVEQHVKLEYLYELYKSEITSYWPDIKMTLGTALIAVAADIVLGENKYVEPDCLKILKVIGPYLPPEKVIACRANPQIIPKEYHDVINQLGIYWVKPELAKQQRDARLSHAFQVNGYHYIYCKPASWKKYLQESARMSFYGLYGVVGLANNTVCRLYTRADDIAGPYIRPVVNNACEFVAKKAEENIPGAMNAVKSLKRKMN